MTRCTAFPFEVCNFSGSDFLGLWKYLGFWVYWVLTSVELIYPKTKTRPELQISSQTQETKIWKILKFQNPNPITPESSKNLKPNTKNCCNSCNFEHHFSPKLAKPKNGTQTWGIFTNPYQIKFENLQTRKTQSWSQWSKFNPNPKNFELKKSVFETLKLQYFGFLGFEKYFGFRLGF